MPENFSITRAISKQSGLPDGPKISRTNSQTGYFFAGFLFAKFWHYFFGLSNHNGGKE